MTETTVSITETTSNRFEDLRRQFGRPPEDEQRGTLGLQREAQSGAVVHVVSGGFWLSSSSREPLQNSI